MARGARVRPCHLGVCRGQGSPRRDRARGEVRGSMSDERGQVTEATKEAEAEEARAEHVADRPATPEEEQLVADRKVGDSVRDHYEEMAERGANDPGEGRIP